MLGLVTALATATALRHDKGGIRSGGVTFHALLIGIVLASTSAEPWYLPLAGPVIILSVIR